MTIGEFSKETDISAYTLRYYEKKGLIHVNRNNAGRRDYSETDIEWVKFIKRLKDTGMLLRDIRYYSELRYQGNRTLHARMELLTEHRNVVLEEQRKWAEYLDNLDRKIEVYKSKLELTDLQEAVRET